MTFPAVAPRMVYTPSAFVCVPRLLPMMLTCAAETGWPLPASVTRPVIVVCCACAVPAALAASTMPSASWRTNGNGLTGDTSLDVEIGNVDRRRSSARPATGAGMPRGGAALR